MWKRPNLKHIRSNTTQKIVLAACSGYLKEMFVAREKKQGEITNSELTKIPLLGIKPKTVDQILEAMYSTSITLSQHTVDDMLSAASFLRIPAVVAACGDFLAEMLCVKNCLRTLQVANLYSLNDLLERCYSMACKNFMAVCHQKEFLKLRYCELQSLLPRQDLAVNTELNAFDAVVRWMDGDKPTRMTYAGRLMRHIRFPFIPESELVDHVEASDYVTNVPKVGDLVREAVRFHLLAHRRSIFQTARTVPRTTFKMNAIIGSGGLSLKRDGSLTDKIFYCDVTDGEWKHLANLPEPRHHHAVAVLGGYLYVAGGDSTEGWSSPSDKVWRYDLWSEEWLTVSCMKKPRESFQMAALDMKLYVVGGRVNNGVTVAEVEVYDPATNSWDEVAPISSPRRHVAVSSLSSKVYAVGGSSDDLVSRRVERYCPASNTWERKQPLIKPRFSASLHSIQNRLYVVGGASVDPADPAVGIYGAAEIEVYTPGTDQWSIFKGLVNTRLNGNLMDSSGGLQLNEWPSSNSECPEEQQFHDRVMVTRSEAGSCSLDGKIYLVGGYSWLNRGRIDNVECVDTNTGDVAKIGSESGNLLGVENELERVGKEVNIQNYPMRCTGVACAVMTLYKIPQTTLGCLSLPEPVRATSKSTKRGNRILPKSAHPRVFPTSEIGGDDDLFSAASPVNTTRNNAIRANSASPHTNTANFFPDKRKNSDIFEWLETSTGNIPGKQSGILHSSGNIEANSTETTGDNANVTSNIFLTQ
ncbi:uncharacterized protein LOC100186900 isoform X2 [Ciona intestinalis]